MAIINKSILFLVFSVFSLHTQAALFSDMLIIGASMSADHSAPSPGKFLAEQVRMGKQNIHVEAKDGKKSTYHKKFIENEIPKMQPNITVGLDLFFHDFKIPVPFKPADEQKLRQTVGVIADHSETFIVGSAIGYEGALDANNLLEQLSEENENILLVDMDSIFKDLYSFSGYHYNVNGVSMVVYRDQVLADGLHPNEFGSRLFTNIIIQKLREKYTDISERDLPYIDIEDFLL
ncbi:MAG: hypothetical protein R2827_10905 [Bdellovibrionales bacterium]